MDSFADEILRMANVKKISEIKPLATSVECLKCGLEAINDTHIKDVKCPNCGHIMMNPPEESKVA